MKSFHKQVLVEVFFSKKQKRINPPYFLFLCEGINI